jgi:hypothetical protein
MFVQYINSDIMVKKNNWVFVEEKDGIEYYVDTIPMRNMVYLIGKKGLDKEIVAIKGDNIQYLPEKYKEIVKEYKDKYDKAKRER